MKMNKLFLIASLFLTVPSFAQTQTVVQKKEYRPFRYETPCALETKTEFEMDNCVVIETRESGGALRTGLCIACSALESTAEEASSDWDVSTEPERSRKRSRAHISPRSRSIKNSEGVLMLPRAHWASRRPTSRLGWISCDKRKLPQTLITIQSLIGSSNLIISR